MTTVAPAARRRLPARWFPWAFAATMGGLMTAIVTLALAWVFDDPGTGLLSRWLPRWLLAWLIATPVIALVSPRLRQWLARYIEPPGA